MNFKVLHLAVSFLLVLSPAPIFSEQALLPTSLPLPSEIPHSINIALIVDGASAFIMTDGPYRVKTPDTSAAYEQKPLKAKVEPSEKGIKIGERVYLTDRLTITVSGGAIHVEKRKYARQIEIIKKAGTITVVNQIDLEEYLKGVLPLEVHHDWPLEALKAQAVISRTFALFKVLEKKDQDYALVDTVQSQVFGGSIFHRESTNRAAELTKGEVLTSGGKLFPSYFHSICGGHTAKANEIWAVEPNPVFQAVPCHFCKEAKYWRWTFKMPVEKIEKIMQDKGYPAKNLQEIGFAKRDKSGRATRVILKYKYSNLVIKADDFRAWIGYERLRSLKATVNVKNGLVYFTGYGWGHGIGFCQWGSKGQSDAGKKYHEILNYYFPGSEVKKI